MFDQQVISDSTFSADTSASTMTDSPQHNLTDADLPAHERDWYEAFIYTKSLGVVFFNAPQVQSSLFLNVDPQLMKIFKNRPVISFIVEGSPACYAGIQIGSVLTKVNGRAVEDSVHATQQISSSTERPLSLLFYRPDIKLNITEGIYFTCYDSSELLVPSIKSNWKSKYIVVGGVISKPWLLSIYRSKAEYDIAVIEIQSQRFLSVDVEQFCLTDSKIIIQRENDRYNHLQQSQCKKEDNSIGNIRYSKESQPMFYLVICPFDGYPIKIASTDLSQVTNILVAVKRVSGIKLWLSSLK